MNMYRKVITVTLLTTLCGMASAQEANDAVEADAESTDGQEQNYQFSRAETILWMEDHLANITEPTEIRYDFSKTGSYEDGFSDQVIMEVVEFHDDDSRSVKLQFFTGHRENKSIQPNQLSEIHGNPVLGVYMQGDTYEMDRLTDGSWRYFHKRIKLALSENADVQKVKVTHDGKEIEAEKVTLAPYVKDPHRVEFDEFADKTYEFIFSEEIPGELYQIRTVIPNNVEQDAEPLITETLTFAGAKSIDPESEQAKK